MLSEKELEDIRHDFALWRVAAGRDPGHLTVWRRQDVSFPADVGNLLDHIREIEARLAYQDALLHDLRRDSDAWRRGWDECCDRIVGEVLNKFRVHGGKGVMDGLEEVVAKIRSLPDTQPYRPHEPAR